MGGVLGKRPRVAAAPDDAGRGLDYTEAAGLKEKGLTDGSGRAVADVKSVDASAGGNGGRALDCPQAADLTRVEADEQDGSSEEGRGRLAANSVDVGATDAAASAGQQEVEHGPFPIDQLQASGIAVLDLDVKKLKDAGLHTVESVAYTPRKDLLQIKEISEAKVDKIIEAVSAKGNGGHNGDPIEGKSSLKDEVSLLEKAKLLADEAMSKVNALAALHLKSGPINKQLMKSSQGKDYMRAMQCKDIAVLSETHKIANGLKHGTASKPSHLHFCAKADYGVYLPTPLSGHHCPRKRKGIDLVLWKGFFAMPTAIISGNDNIDGINLILFDIYMSIHDLLEVANVSAKVAEVGRGRDAAAKESKAAVRILRSTCKKIHDILLDLGFSPINEPDGYWKEVFPLVKF